MTHLHPYQPLKPLQFVLKIREMAADSWWVYRSEIGFNGMLKQMPRVVFFGRSRAEVDSWVEQQRQEATVFMLSEN